MTAFHAGKIEKKKKQVRGKKKKSNNAENLGRRILKPSYRKVKVRDIPLMACNSNLNI